MVPSLAWWRSKIALAVQPCSSSVRIIAALARKVTRASPRTGRGFFCVINGSERPRRSIHGVL